MCYGKKEAQMATCNLCKVTRTSQTQSTRCPHQTAVCKMMVNHPKFEVVYYTNAEFASMNGCGFCRWAKHRGITNVTDAYENSGWPGCCRPPLIQEHDYIKSSAHWAAVQTIFGTQPPPHVVAEMRASQPGSRPQPPVAPPPPVARPGSDVRPQGVIGYGASGGPAAQAYYSQQPATGPRPQPSSDPTQPQPRQQRRASVSTGHGVAPAGATPSSRQGGNPSQQPQQPQLRRQASHGGSYRWDSLSQGHPVTQSQSQRPPARSSTLDSSMSQGSGTEGSRTVTSEGFTDYLSEESDKDLQRQAEERAERHAQNAQENREFQKARDMVSEVTELTSHWRIQSDQPPVGQPVGYSSRGGGPPAHYAPSNAPPPAHYAPSNAPPPRSSHVYPPAPHGVPPSQRPGQTTPRQYPAQVPPQPPQQQRGRRDSLSDRRDSLSDRRDSLPDRRDPHGGGQPPAGTRPRRDSSTTRPQLAYFGGAK